jgi:hypothetical protein
MNTNEKNDNGGKREVALMGCKRPVFLVETGPKGMMHDIIISQRRERAVDFFSSTLTLES